MGSEVDQADSLELQIQVTVVPPVHVGQVPEVESSSKYMQCFVRR